jgi:transcriptional regulator with XRE-family HTH domain
VKNHHGPRTDLDLSTLAERLRTRRDETGLSQEQVAELAGVSRGTVRNAELGKALGAASTAAIHRALGWRRQETRDDSTPYQVLGADTVTAIGGVLTDRRLLSESDRERACADYIALVTALEEDKPLLPPGFDRLANTLRSQARPADLAHLVGDLERNGLPEADLLRWANPEMEIPPLVRSRENANAITRIYQIVSDQDAHRRALVRSGADPDQLNAIVLRSMFGDLLPMEALAIARSDLNRELQDGLAQYISEQRRQFNASVMTTIRELISDMDTIPEEPPTSGDR